MNSLYEITDPSLRDELHREAVSNIEGLERALHIKANLIKSKRWIAQPIPPWGGWLEDKYAGWIADSMVKRSLLTCFGVAIEGYPIPKAYMAPATFEGISQLRDCRRPFMFTLFPEDRSFLILGTALDYSVIAGPSDFVKDACGGDINKVRGEFLEHIEETAHREGNRLVEVLAYYDERTPS